MEVVYIFYEGGQPNCCAEPGHRQDFLVQVWPWQALHILHARHSGWIQTSFETSLPLSVFSWRCVKQTTMLRTLRRALQRGILKRRRTLCQSWRGSSQSNTSHWKATVQIFQRAFQVGEEVRVSSEPECPTQRCEEKERRTCLGSCQRCWDWSSWSWEGCWGPGEEGFVYFSLVLL